MDKKIFISAGIAFLLLSLIGNISAAEKDISRTCITNRDCKNSLGTKMFCELKDCSNNMFGNCMAVPKECPMIYEPVCGCDGVTYSNDCVRQSNQVSKKYDGECKQEPKSCFTNSDCNDGKFCEFRGCKVKTGECVKVPEFCIEVYSPVCGCDELTYSNECAAHQEKVSVKNDGECNESECESGKTLVSVFKTNSKINFCIKNRFVERLIKTLKFWERF